MQGGVVRIAGILAGAIALAAAGYGQNLNVDIDASFGPGVAGPPSSAFGAAAGQIGYWDSFNGAGNPPKLLRGLDGALTSVLMTGPVGGASLAVNYPGLVGDYKLLMADARSIDLFDDFKLTGLANGFYKVYFYMVCPAVGISARISSVSIAQSVSANPQFVSGPMQINTFSQGVTHSVHLANVTSNRLDIRLASEGTYETYFNGFQVVAVPEPITLAIVAPAVALTIRRRRSHQRAVANTLLDSPKTPS